MFETWANEVRRQRRLPEARPPLAAVIGQFGLAGEARRDQEEDGVVDLGALGEELARDDGGVRRHVGIDERAVIVVGPPAGAYGV